MRKKSGVVTSSTVTTTDPFQRGSQCDAQRSSTTSPAPKPNPIGVTQRTRSQPGAVKRCQPVGAGGAVWWSWVCATSIVAISLLRSLGQILHELGQLLRRDLRAEDVR